MGGRGEEGGREGPNQSPPSSDEMSLADASTRRCPSPSFAKGNLEMEPSVRSSLGILETAKANQLRSTTTTPGTHTHNTRERRRRGGGSVCLLRSPPSCSPATVHANKHARAPHEHPPRRDEGAWGSGRTGTVLASRPLASKHPPGLSAWREGGLQLPVAFPEAKHSFLSSSPEVDAPSRRNRTGKARGRRRCKRKVAEDGEGDRPEVMARQQARESLTSPSARNYEPGCLTKKLFALLPKDREAT